MKYLDIKEFRDMGLVQEINRLFLHPLGLALELTVDSGVNGDVYTISGIQDYRDDPEGVIFETVDQDKVKKVWDLISQRHPIRQEKLGYVIQMD